MMFKFKVLCTVLLATSQPLIPLVIIKGWKGTPPPRLVVPLSLCALLCTTILAVWMYQVERRGLARVVGFLIGVSVAATAVTANTVALRAISACIAATPIVDVPIHLDRAYDLLHDDVLCRYSAPDGRTAERRVRSWTVLNDYGVA